MEIIATEQAPKAIGPYSQAVVANGMIFTSGQIALRPDGSFEDGDVIKQTNQVLKNLSEILKAAGSDLSKVIKTNVYLSDMNDFAAMNEVYEGYFGKHKPARSTLAVKTIPKDGLVEIECVALI